MSLQIQLNQFNPWSDLSGYESFLCNQTDRYYAISASATFIGSMCDLDEANNARDCNLEQYPEMAIHMISELESETNHHWPLQYIFIVHGVGQLYPGKPVILIAVWSSLRGDAFEACRNMIEHVELTIPLWHPKKHVANG